MSTPDQPETTPLTRRRMREIRATGANPVIPPPSEQDAPEPAEPTAPEPVAPAPTPLPRAAEPAPVPPAPLADISVDLGTAALTRRQARNQERIRTASVPVIHADAVPSPSAAVVPPVTEAPIAPDEAAPPVTGDAEPTAADSAEAEASDAAVGPLDGLVVPDADDTPVAPPLVNPELGSDLLAGQAPAVTIPPSFDQLIARGTSGTGSVATPNALILSQVPAAAPLAPISATGEVLITGSFDLPAGLGSVGHAHGTTDGKDVDAALIDGELPASSSPTPIAASAAISTARHSGEEIIRPPAPEKGNRLMLALVITAGVLALALVGVLIFAMTTGVF
jgi:hypothetical protein